MGNKGKVKWFDAKKGYGFIVTSKMEEYFFHYSSILQNGYKKLEPGDVVTFDLIAGKEGKMVAINVSKEQLGN